jgi:hypothetical protein
VALDNPNPAEERVVSQSISEKPRVSNGKPDWRETLARLGACEDAAAWAKGFKGTARQAWLACERGDWLMWLCARLEVDRKLVVTAACDCAEPALKYVRAGEDRPRKAIETARAWVRGEATIAEVRAAAAADAAAAAADAARQASFKESADIVRKAVPWPVVAKALKGRSK